MPKDERIALLAEELWQRYQECHTATTFAAERQREHWLLDAEEILKAVDTLKPTYPSR